MRKKRGGGRHIDDMFSLEDFHKILEGIIAKDNLDSHLPKQEHIMAEEMEVYSEKRILPYLHHQFIPWNSIYAYGYRAIITKDTVYYYYDLGQDFLMKRNLPYYAIPPYILDTSSYDDEEIRRMRELVQIDGIVPLDKEKFPYAYLFQQVVKNAMPRNLKKVECLNDILSPYGEKSVAIRTGGGDACDIYLELRDENKAKITCVIDVNEDCPLHSVFGVPLISPDKANIGEFSAVIMGTRRLRSMILNEAKEYPAEVKLLDIEKLLEEKGFHCGPDFWDIETVPEDWDVGFPEMKQA